MKIKINCVHVLETLWWISSFRPLVIFEWLANVLEDRWEEKGLIQYSPDFIDELLRRAEEPVE